MNLQVCQKNWEPTVITINHREIIKEWAGAVRLAEVHGWKGPLDVLGGVWRPLWGTFTVCLLICLFQDWMIHRLWDGFTSKRLCFLISCMWLFTFLCSRWFLPLFSFFFVVEIHSLHDARQGGFEEYFLVAPRFHRHFFSYFTVIYIPVIHQSSSTAVRYAEFWRISLQRLIRA